MTRSRRPRGGGPAREPTAGSFNPSLAQAMAGWLLRPARASFLRRAARPAILKRLNVRASQRAATLASARARRYRSEEHTSELQSLMRISYAVFCLKKKKQQEENANNKH